MELTPRTWTKSLYRTEAIPGGEYSHIKSATNCPTDRRVGWNMGELASEKNNNWR